jgi:acyl carrier protein
MDSQIVSQREAVFTRLQSLLNGFLKVMREKDIKKRPKITWETDLIDDLGVDSLETLDLMNAIEEEFQVNPDLHEANSKRKIYQVVDYIFALQQRKRL